MVPYNDLKHGNDASISKPYKNLTFQDALIVIAVYAMQIYVTKDYKDIDRVASLAEGHSLFQGNIEDIISKIYRLTNMLPKEDPINLVSLAAKSLTFELRETAFEWAVELLGNNEVLSKDKLEKLDQLKYILEIDSNVANKLIRKAVIIR